jgi:hypothetical protein
MSISPCSFVKVDGKRCGNRPAAGTGYCWRHKPASAVSPHVGGSPSAQRSQGNELRAFIVIVTPVLLMTFSVWIFIFAMEGIQRNVFRLWYYTQQNINIGILWFFRLIAILRYALTVVHAIASLCYIFGSEGSALENTARKYLIFSSIIVPPVIGLQNLAFYALIDGWDDFRASEAFEGASLAIIYVQLLLIILASKLIRHTKMVNVIRFIFDILFAIIPITFASAIIYGGYTTIPIWIICVQFALQTIYLYLAIQDIEGNTDIFKRVVMSYIAFENGEEAIKVMRSGRYDALIAAIKTFRKLSPSQQEELSRWIVLNNRPSWLRRVWGVFKLIVVTFSLTVVAQEPAVALLKWAVGFFFGGQS